MRNHLIGFFTTLFMWYIAYSFIFLSFSWPNIATLDQRVGSIIFFLIIYICSGAGVAIHNDRKRYHLD